MRDQCFDKHTQLSSFAIYIVKNQEEWNMVLWTKKTENQITNKGGGKIRKYVNKMESTKGKWTGWYFGQNRNGERPERWST